MPISALVLAIGCGDDESEPDRAGAGPAKTSAEQTPPARTAEEHHEPKAYRERVANCVGGVGFDTRNAGNALRVESPGGDRIANIQTFKTAAEARRFHSRLAVEGTHGGRGVAVWQADADDTQKRVVGDCLTP